MDQNHHASATSHAQQSATNKKRNHSVLWWPLAMLILALLVVAIHHHRNKKRVATAAAEQSRGPVTIQTTIAQTGDLPIYLDAIGTVTPVYTDSITAQVTGVITAVHYHEGQIVQKGDPLIDLDAKPYLAQLGEARGTLEHDENLLSQARMDLTRYQEAWAGNGIARQQLEDQEKTVLQEQGTVNYDRAAVQYAQVQVNYCHIVAPISGRVGLRLVDPGNLVTANATTTLAVITQLHPITVVFTLAQDDILNVQKTMRHNAALTVEAYDRVAQQKLGAGKLITLDNQIDTTTGTVKLRAFFDNADNTLFPNQFVNTRLLLETLHNQILIPDNAIQRNGDMAFVYEISNGKTVMHAITAGASEHGMTAVEGLRSGDIVANSSFEKLQDGTPVSIAEGKQQ